MDALPPDMSLPLPRNGTLCCGWLAVGLVIRCPRKHAGIAID